MRISDWSSDVCSSDLPDDGRAPQLAGAIDAGVAVGVDDHEVAGTDQRGDRAQVRLVAGGEAGRLAFAVRLAQGLDRKSVGEGKSVSVRVDLGGRRFIKKNNHTQAECIPIFSII